MLRNPQKGRGTIVLLLLGLFGAASLLAGEPQPEANWDNLKHIAAGDDVQVVLGDAKSFDAKFQTYSDSAIIVRTISGEQTFSREDVLRVSAKGKSHRTRNTIIGAGIGFGAGLGTGAAVAASQRSEYPQNRYTEVGAIAGVALAAAGAGVGALLPTGGWHVVYRAR